MHIESIEDLATLSQIADEWNSLASRFNTPLLRHEWFASSAEAFCPPGKLSVMVARDNGAIVAIAPLVLNPVFGQQRLELLGTATLQEPSGIIYADSNSLKGLMGEILSSRRPILFSGLDADSPELSLLKTDRHPARFYTRTLASASPWIPIATDWEKFYPTISSSWRSALRRAQRRAEEFGPLEFEMVSPNPETLGPYLTDIFHVEAAGWKARTGTALESNPALARFFQIYAQSAARLGMLRLAFLRIKAKPVAVQLMVEFAKRVWVFKVGFDEEFSRCSPGILLMHRVIEQAFKLRLDAVELLGADAPWLGIWKPQYHFHETVRRYPLSPGPLASHGLELSADTYKRVRTIFKKEQDKSPWRTIFRKLGARIRRSKTAPQKEP